MTPQEAAELTAHYVLSQRREDERCRELTSKWTRCSLAIMFRDSDIPEKMMTGWKPSLRELELNFSKEQLALMLAKYQGRTEYYAEQLTEAQIDIEKLGKIMDSYPLIPRGRSSKKAMLKS